MSNFLVKMQKRVPLVFWPKCPMNMADLRKPQKIGNIDRILLQLVWLDAEFILVCIDTTTNMNKHLLAEKSIFFKEYSI